MTLQKTRETRDELTTDELDLVSGGRPGIGISYGASTTGVTFIQWGDGTGTGSWTMTQGKNGTTWTHN
jgi:hypothetical protein